MRTAVLEDGPGVVGAPDDEVCGEEGDAGGGCGGEVGEQG